MEEFLSRFLKFNIAQVVLQVLSVEANGSAIFLAFSTRKALNYAIFEHWRYIIVVVPKKWSVSLRHRSLGPPRHATNT